MAIPFLLLVINYLGLILILKNKGGVPLVRQAVKPD